MSKDQLDSIKNKLDNRDAALCKINRENSLLESEIDEQEQKFRKEQDRMSLLDKELKKINNDLSAAEESIRKLDRCISEENSCLNFVNKALEDFSSENIPGKIHETDLFVVKDIVELLALQEEAIS